MRNDRLHDELSKLGETWRARGSPIVSAERALALVLLKAGTGQGGAAPIPFDRFLRRPSAEEVISRFWPELCSPRLDLEEVTMMASGLTGIPAALRSHAGSTVPDVNGQRSLFPAPELSRHFARRISEKTKTDDPLSNAVTALAETVLSHPYPDGNGRLGRAMMYRALGTPDLVQGPLLPLGPLFYANHRRISGSMTHLGVSGDWEPLYRTIEALVSKAAAFSLFLLEGNLDRYGMASSLSASTVHNSSVC